jgi:hypothetical protein
MTWVFLSNWKFASAFCKMLAAAPCAKRQYNGKLRRPVSHQLTEAEEFNVVALKG